MTFCLFTSPHYSYINNLYSTPPFYSIYDLPQPSWALTACLHSPEHRQADWPRHLTFSRLSLFLASHYLINTCLSLQQRSSDLVLLN